MSLESQIDKFAKSIGLVYYVRRPSIPRYNTIEQYQYDIIGNLRTLRDYEPMLLPRKLLGLSDDRFATDVTDVALEMAQRVYNDERSNELIIDCIAITKKGCKNLIEEVESSEDFIRWL